MGELRGRRKPSKDRRKMTCGMPNMLFFIVNLLLVGSCLVITRAQAVGRRRES